MIHAKCFIAIYKNGFAPISHIAPTVATKVFAAVITSSPLPTQELLEII